jgi:hypothetical protein
MRCSEARQRLIKSRGMISDSARENELRKHLQVCPECAAFAQAEQTLHRDFAKAAVDDNADDMPLSVLKSRVETRSGLADRNNPKEYTIMATITRQLRKRPKLGISLGLAAIMLAFVTLVPFSFKHTSGYEVAIAGVNKDLAMDSEKITELMFALGMDDAEVDVGDCESTCKLTIKELKSDVDVKIVIAAFNELGDCVLEEVKEVSTDEHTSLVDYAKYKFYFTHQNKLDYRNEDEIHDIVIERIDALKSDSNSTFNIWIGEDSGDYKLIDLETASDSCLFIAQADGKHLVHEIGLGLQSGAKYYFSDSDSGVFTEVIISGDSPHWVDEKEGNILLHSGTGHSTVSVETNDDGSTIFHVTDVDGEVHRINLEDGDAEARLKELGIETHFVTKEDGLLHQVFICSQDGSEHVDITDAMDEKHKAHKDSPEAALPDGYVLSQNHPNPFNPYTAFRFSVPEIQHVSIEIYNVNGQKVRTLVDEVVTVGEHSAEWDSKDNSGRRVASGVYVYRMTAGDVTTSRKMTLLK